MVNMCIFNIAWNPDLTYTGVNLRSAQLRLVSGPSPLIVLPLHSTNDLLDCFQQLAEPNVCMEHLSLLGLSAASCYPFFIILPKDTFLSSCSQEVSHQQYL